MRRRQPEPQPPAAARTATESAAAVRAQSTAALPLEVGRETIVLADTPLHRQPLVSVIIPTCTPDRLDLLRGAIDSVLNQSYRALELLVVDHSNEGMLDPQPSWWPVDERIRVLRSPVQQASTARNVGLDASSGELIAYLDDDCRWFPWWLHAAAATFEATPDNMFVHGIRFSGGQSSSPGLVQAESVTPLRLHVDNCVDTNTLVHRADIGERWDDDLHACSDYDLVVRLAGHQHQLVPIPACTDAVGTPEQVRSAANSEENDAQRDEVRSRARRRRPLRIVAHNSLYPLVSETYIGDELEALRRCGAEIVLSRVKAGPGDCPSRIDVPLYESLEAAIEAHDPDLVLCHWAGTAMSSRQVATDHGVPHAVRLHSMCEPISNERIFDEWCIGGWGPPHFDRHHPRSHILPTLVVDPTPPGTDADRQRSLLSISAGLPKKNWPTLIHGAAATGAALDIAMGLTEGWFDQPDVARGLLAEAGLPDRVHVNVPYAVGQQMMRSAGALVYTIEATQPIGQPRSVIEAALSATPIVAPEATALRDMLGDTAHYYDRADDESLAAAMLEALDHPRPEPERLALAEQIRQRHAHHSLFEDWTIDLTTALVEWQLAHADDPVRRQRNWWMGRIRSLSPSRPVWQSRVARLATGARSTISRAKPSSAEVRAVASDQ